MLSSMPPDISRGSIDLRRCTLFVSESLYFIGMESKYLDSGSVHVVHINQVWGLVLMVPLLRGLHDPFHADDVRFWIR
jgi:hypothetical protein